MNNLKDIIKVVESLSAAELETLSSEVLKLLKTSPDVAKNNTEELHNCRRCGSHAILKYGKDKNGKQRYKCKNCNAIFYATSYSVISKSRHDLSVWKRYIILLLKGASLEECDKECLISVQTAFTWRHKILHALQSDQSNRMLGGVVEIDDMFFSVSYKGNHKKSKNFVMPRKPYKRGTDNTGVTGNMACVLCACERQGQAYAEVTGIGSVNVEQLNYAFNNRLLEDSIALSDKAYSYKNYFSNTSIELIQLASHSIPKNQSSPPEVKGSYHIQNVNNFHRRFRRTMKHYNGVATKYLNHYVNLFVWIENHKKIDEFSLPSQMFSQIYEKNTYISHENIVAMPPIPKVA